jgi:hypothetical protein
MNLNDDGVLDEIIDPSGTPHHRFDHERRDIASVDDIKHDVRHDGNDPNAVAASRGAGRRRHPRPAAQHRSIDPSRHRRHRTCSRARPAPGRAST